MRKADNLIDAPIVVEAGMILPLMRATAHSLKFLQQQPMVGGGGLAVYNLMHS